RVAQPAVGGWLIRDAMANVARRQTNRPPRRTAFDPAIRNPQSAIAAIGIFLGLQTPDPWPVLDRASQTYQTISTLSADFVQVIVNPLIGSPDTSRGKIYQ